jgi:hypothetical protein
MQRDGMAIGKHATHDRRRFIRDVFVDQEKSGHSAFLFEHVE